MRDLLDEQPPIELRDAAAVVRQLEEWLPGATVAELAGLLGCSERQLQRMRKEGRSASSRMQVVARLVAILRHAWTDRGVVAWFDRPREDLGGASRRRHGSRTPTHSASCCSPRAPDACRPVADADPPPPRATRTLTAFRWSSYDVLFWARPNSRAGRWHRAGDEPTQYWALSPQAAWAELLRAEALHTEADVALVEMPLWTCRTPAARLVDLREPAVQAAHGPTADGMVADAWAACQDARRCLRATARGVITPSAALPGHASLVLFGGRRAIDWSARPALASAVPVTVVAIGRPQVGLAGQVRHRANARFPPPRC